MYRLFMEEYVQDAAKEMSMNEETMCYAGIEDESFNESYYFESENNSNEKDGVYKINYYLRDHLQIPYIQDVLSKASVQDRLIEFVSKFLDDHSKELSTSGPVHIIVFGDKETNFLYEMFGLNKEMIIDFYDNMIKEAFYGKISKFITGWVLNAPHKILLTSMLIEAIQKGYDDMVECCEYLWAFSEYPIIYRDYWKTGVKEDVMDYTIEHLGTKFTVKKVPNLQALLKYDAHVSVVNKYELLKTGADHAYTDFMYRFRNQFNNRYKNIALAYYANNEANASQHVKDSQFDDGKLVDQDGHTTNIAQIVDKTINSFLTGEVNNAYAKICADGAKVDKDNLIGYLNLIFKSKDNNLSKIVENIITAFFLKNPSETTVGTVVFMNFGLALYRSIGTSKDPLYQEIKSILSYWVYDLINIKQFYSREGTWIAYTRSIFNYLIFMIHEYN